MHPLPKKSPGDLIRAADWNEILQRLERLSRPTATGAGLSYQDFKRFFRRLHLPALQTQVFNVGDTDIPPFGVAGIENLLWEGVDIRATTEPILKVQKPLPRHFGRWVVAKEAVFAGYRGLAWFSGIVPVRLMRWWTPALRRCDIYAGHGSTPAQYYALENVNGAAEILWEEEGASVGAERWAIVHLTKPTCETFRYKNTGASTVPLGGAVTYMPGDASGLTTEGALKLISPLSDDRPHETLVNLGGDVAVNAEGVVQKCTEPFLGEVNLSCVVGQSVGVNGVNTVFVKGETGFRVLAYLGASTSTPSRLYAIISKECAKPDNLWLEWDAGVLEHKGPFFDDTKPEYAKKVAPAFVAENTPETWQYLVIDSRGHVLGFLGSGTLDWDPFGLLQ